MMFREMRRNKQLLSKEEIEGVLHRCTNGILACLGDEDYPYAVPLSYVYHHDKIYFHSAKSGHNIDAIKKTPKVSFAVVDQDQVISETYTTHFRSVVAFGKARIAEGEEWREAFYALVEKYSGDQPEEDKVREIEGCSHSYIIAIDVAHISGKASIELIKVKQGHAL